MIRLPTHSRPPIVRALWPEATLRQRLAHLLEDLECHVWDETKPARRTALKFFDAGADAVNQGLQSGEAQIAKLIRAARERGKKLFPSF